MKINEIKIGDWVTQYDSGYWKVLKILPQYATEDYKSEKVNWKKGELIGYLSLLKKGFTSKMKYRLDCKSCNIEWYKKVDDSINTFINEYFKDNIKQKEEFDKAEYKERPVITSIWLELDNKDQIEKIQEWFKVLPSKFNSIELDDLLIKKDIKKMIIANPSWAKNDELVGIIYLHSHLWEFDSKKTSFLYFNPQIQLANL